MTYMQVMPYLNSFFAGALTIIAVHDRVEGKPVWGTLSLALLNIACVVSAFIARS